MHRAQAGLRGTGLADAAQPPRAAGARRGRPACVPKDPQARFQAADQFITALESAVAGVHPESLAPREDPVALLEDADRAQLAARRDIAVVLLALGALAIGPWLVRAGRGASVPNVVGKRSGTAAQILQSGGFQVDVVPIRSDTVADDRVAGQRPEPGEEAKEGSTVTITVSSGPGEGRRSLSCGACRSTRPSSRLREAGFKSERRNEFSDTVRDGRVIETSPSEGSTVRKGTTVTLVVSRGKEQVAVPDVVGQHARRGGAHAPGRRPAGLGERGGVRGRRARHRAQPGPGGRARGSPRARPWRSSSPRGPAEVPVPGVIDATEEEAVQTLEDAGFEVG